MGNGQMRVPLIRLANKQSILCHLTLFIMIISLYAALPGWLELPPPRPQITSYRLQSAGKSPAALRLSILVGLTAVWLLFLPASYRFIHVIMPCAGNSFLDGLPPYSSLKENRCQRVVVLSELFTKTALECFRVYMRELITLNI
jgi:hypothetical protein